MAAFLWGFCLGMAAMSAMWWLSDRSTSKTLDELRAESDARWRELDELANAVTARHEAYKRQRQEAIEQGGLN